MDVGRNGTSVEVELAWGEADSLQLRTHSEAMESGIFEIVEIGETAKSTKSGLALVNRCNP